MKRLSMMIILLFLAACQSPPDDDADIDWPDFVQLGDIKYEVAPSTVVTNDKAIEKEAGEVNYTIDQNVQDASYQAKDGDAAYLKKGTKLFHIKDHTDFLAVPDSEAINGYKVYRSEDADTDQHYDKLDLDSINHVEIYGGQEDPKNINKLTGKKQIHMLTDLLDKGEPNPDFSPDIDKEDPAAYHLVFYEADSPIANRYRLFYDGETWYWHPDETETLPDETGETILAP